MINQGRYKPRAWLQLCTLLTVLTKEKSNGWGKELEDAFPSEACHRCLLPAFLFFILP